MASIHFESSFTPPLDYQLPDIALGPGGGIDLGEPAQGLGPNLWLKIIRPSFQIDLPLIGKQTIEPGGKPVPWFLGLGALLIAVAILASYLTKLRLLRK